MVEVSRRENVALVELAAGKANALDGDICRELRKCIASEGSTEAAGIVIAAKGAMFSAGIDLLKAAQDTASFADDFLPAMSELLHTVWTLEKPVIAAVNGHAIAGGCLIVCAADWRILGSASAKIGVPELKLGLPLPSLAFDILRAVVTPGRLAEVLYDGGTYAADAAIKVGLADEIVRPEDLISASIAKAAAWGAIHAPAFTLMKRRHRMIALAQSELEPGFDHKVQNVWRSREVQDGLQRYASTQMKKNG